MQNELTAYELADKLENEDCCCLDMEQFSNMLRQQADRILELDVNLKAQIKLAYEQADRIESLLTMAEGFQSLINHQAEHIAELEFRLDATNVFSAKQTYRIAELEASLKDIIAISDRKHDAWDTAKELLKQGEK